MLTTVVLGFSAAILAVLAVIVIYSNYRSPVNRWLGAFILSGLAWLSANLLVNIYSDSAQLSLLFTRAALIGSALVPFTFVMFCYALTRKRTSRTKKMFWALPVVILLASTFTALNVKSVDVATNTFEPGPAYVVLMVVLVSYFSFGTWMLVDTYRKSTRLKREQLYNVLLGVTLTVIPGLMLNGVLPLMGYTQAASFGPVVVLFFAVFTSIAIVRHGLLNVRLVIARALGYAGSLALLAGLYGVLVFGIADLVFDVRVSLGAQVLLSVATGIAALSFGYIKTKFDTITNRLFYQDAYDPQELFDKLNKLLLSSLDLNYLMEHVTIIVQSYLRTEYCKIALFGFDDGSVRIFGDSRSQMSARDIENIRKLVGSTHKGIIVTDQLGDSHHPLQDILQRHGVATLVILAQSAKKRDGQQGFIMLGAKKSGNPYGQQDMRTLENIANELVIAIQNAVHFEEIQYFNATLQARVDEATRKLRRTNEKLKALDEAKDDFVSMASHQLRTPLTSIKGYTSMVLEGDAGKINATQRKLLEQSFFSSQRMVYLIADLLNVSRLKTGKFVIEPAPVNLAEIVQQEIGQLKDVAAGRQLTLEYEQPKVFPSLMLDETKTRQVIMNFIDNGIYYTPAGGHIDVKLVETPTFIEFRVTDNGIGVPKREQPHLFTKFYRAGNARKARPDGTGLGLFMAKKVIAAEGGAIIFETVEGKGSTFGFMFPKTMVVAPDAAPLGPVSTSVTDS